MVVVVVLLLLLLRELVPVEVKIRGVGHERHGDRSAAQNVLFNHTPRGP